jgi:hypothetical protein
MRASCSGIVGTALPRTARKHPAGLAESLMIWRCYSRRTGLLRRSGARHVRSACDAVLVRREVLPSIRKMRGSADDIRNES